MDRLVTRKSRPRPLGGFQEFTDRKVGPGLKKFSQVPGECGRPQSQNIVVPAPGSRNGNHVRGDCCFTQPLYQIGRKERDVPGKGRQAIGPKRCGPFHPGKDAGQGPGGFVIWSSPTRIISATVTNMTNKTIGTGLAAAGLMGLAFTSGPALADFVVSGDIMGEICADGACAAKTIDEIKGGDARALRKGGKFKDVTEYNAETGMCRIELGEEAGIIAARTVFMEVQRDGNEVVLALSFINFNCTVEKIDEAH
jgi:hypothetical protein